MTTPDKAVQLASGPAWANRYALAPVTNKQSHDDGTLSDAEHEWFVARHRRRVPGRRPVEPRSPRQPARRRS